MKYFPTLRSVFIVPDGQSYDIDVNSNSTVGVTGLCDECATEQVNTGINILCYLIFCASNVHWGESMQRVLDVTWVIIVIRSGDVRN